MFRTTLRKTWYTMAAAIMHVFLIYLDIFLGACLVSRPQCTVELVLGDLLEQKNTQFFGPFLTRCATREPWHGHRNAMRGILPECDAMGFGMALP